MKDERVWRVVGDDERNDGHLLKRFVMVGAVAVAAGFGLSLVYSRSDARALTSVFARETPADSAESDRVVSDDESRGEAPLTHSAESDPANDDGRDDAEVSVNGDWHVTTRVRSATRKEFEGLTLGYRLQLTQDGARVTGQGQKITENGRPLDARQRTPIAVEGEREGDRLMLKFTERSARRASGGTFLLRVEDEGLRGTFASDAAGSKGEVSGERVQRAAANPPQQKSRAR